MDVGVDAEGNREAERGEVGIFYRTQPIVTAQRPNQFILKEISPGCSLEGLMLKLKLQYFGHLMEELTHWKRP